MIPDGWTRYEIEDLIGTAEPEELAEVPIVISLDPPDASWAEEICMDLTDHDDPLVRGNAILALGHLARTTGDLDEERARAAIAAGLEDEDEYVRDQAEAAADDVETFLEWVIER